MSGSVLSVNTSSKKGEAKTPVTVALLREDHGIEGDCHAGPGEKQVSLLSWESVEAQLELMREKGVKCPKAEELANAAAEATADGGSNGNRNGNRRSSPIHADNGSSGETHRRASACIGGSDGEGDAYEIRPGDYAENFTVRGVDLKAVAPGDRIEVGADVVLEVTRIGKECHRHCAVYRRLGDCVMPREGVFARVLAGGRARAGDDVRLTAGGSPSR